MTCYFAEHYDMYLMCCSVTFTADNQKLYCASADGRVAMWEHPSQPKLNRNTRFRPFLV